jgi:hypothetical protein
VDGPVDAPAAEQGGVGSVDDRLDVPGGDAAVGGSIEATCLAMPRP